jgi:hypothetical protein
MPAIGGNAYASGRPVEQLHPQMHFEILEQRRHGRLGHVQHLRCPGERAGINYADKHFHCLQSIHMNYSDR